MTFQRPIKIEMTSSFGDVVSTFTLCLNLNCQRKCQIKSIDCKMLRNAIYKISLLIQCYVWKFIQIKYRNSNLLRNSFSILCRQCFFLHLGQKYNVHFQSFCLANETHLVCRNHHDTVKRNFDIHCSGCFQCGKFILFYHLRYSY